MQDELIFDAEHAGWKALKKAVLSGKSEKEVSALLDEVRELAMAQSFRLFEPELNLKIIESMTQSYLSGKLKAQDVRKQLASACSDRKFLPIAESYFLRQIAAKR